MERVIDMATPWEDPIKASKSLSIFAGSSVSGGAWAKVFTDAIAQFNSLSTANSLGVTFKLASAAPDPSGVGGADVQFEAASGTVSFVSFGQQISVNANGTSLSGDTKQVMTVFGNTKRIAKAINVVPATPQVNANPVRDVGDGVKLVIAVHELIHAVGLSNADHSPDDLFNGFPQVRAGSKPEDDKIEVNGPKRLPPLFLAKKTIAAIQNNWK